MNSDSVSRQILLVAAISGAVAVLLGSFGAHGLKAYLESQVALAAEASPEETEQAESIVAKRLDQFDVGVRYHMWHSLALLGLAAVPVGSAKCRRIAMLLMVAGIVMFSGGLYALVFTGISKFAAVAPFGGVSLILAWVALIWVARTGVTVDDK